MTEHGLRIIVFLLVVQLLSYGYCDWIAWMMNG